MIEVRQCSLQTFEETNFTLIPQNSYTQDLEALSQTPNIGTKKTKKQKCIEFFKLKN